MPTLFNDGSENVPFLNPNEIADGDLIMFVTAGKIVSDRWADNRLQIDVRLSTGEVRRLTVNKTSQKSLATAYGPDTSAWVNCQARVSKPTLPIGGNWKTVIILSPVASAK
jgi:hypothetical protein